MTFEVEKSSESEELAWLAEQYVLGALDNAQRDAFEMRLAGDQTAREAVASSVALLAASHEAAPLQSEKPVPAPTLTSTWANRAAWVSGVAAAIALTAFGAWQITRDQVETASALAGAWSETRESIDEDVDDEVLAMTDANVATLDEVDLPDWLITAVSLGEEAIPEAKRSSTKPDASEGA